MPDKEDLSSDYMAASEQRSRAQNVREFEDWSQHFKAGDDTTKAGGTPPFVEGVDPDPASKIKGRPLPEPKPLRRKTDDSLGRLEGEESASGAFMRHVSEVPRQAVGGVDDAARNALQFLNPLTDWLNDNIVDLRYDPVSAPKSITGEVTRKISEFLTGFIPALKGLRAAGMTGKVLPPMAAGAIADFTVRDSHEGRLSDLWNEMGLPHNVLTDYRKSNPHDSEAEGRFKGALEGVAVGSAMEGIMLGARALLAARSVKGA